VVVGERIKVRDAKAGITVEATVVVIYEDGYVVRIDRSTQTYVWRP
jgi:hypothetical protein